MSQSDRPFLSIVVPAYNERLRLGRSLGQIRDYLADSGRPAETVVVDDGSTDGTAELAAGLAGRGLALRVLRNPANRGKGYSVRRGMLAADGEVLLMTDADLSAPIGEAEKLLGWLERGFDVAIGSRHVPEAVLGTSRALKRRIMEKAFRRLRRRRILPEISDTQCGFKLFRRQAARKIFQHQTVNGFAFDCEVLALARRFGYRVKEVGVVWCDDPESRLRPVRDSIEMLRSLRRIRRRMAQWARQDAAGSPPGD